MSCWDFTFFSSCLKPPLNTISPYCIQYFSLSTPSIYELSHKLNSYNTQSLLVLSESPLTSLWRLHHHHHDNCSHFHILLLLYWPLQRTLFILFDDSWWHFNAQITAILYQHNKMNFQRVFLDSNLFNIKLIVN
jgi:hypothetical protein